MGTPVMFTRRTALMALGAGVIGAGAVGATVSGRWGELRPESPDAALAATLLGSARALSQHTPPDSQLARTLRAHVTALRSVVSPESPTRTRHSSVARHARLLMHAASRAESGALARLCASMYAGITVAVGKELTAMPDPAQLERSHGDVDVWQELLARFHAAMFETSALGARMADPALAIAAFVQQQAIRDQLQDLIQNAGAEPVVALAVYAPPTRGTTARDVQQRCDEGLAWAGAEVAAANRRITAAWLAHSALRTSAFQGIPEIFPGASDWSAA